ncbi:PLP-dependent transferase [Rhizoctonia solani]|uniref:PLP-dependent transferase n=1 Tax=Rhizoctonia solani TaxID=456999 RepID=A0A8H7INT1_9AGAM|nr:PLP-dependent transferase [Rhizoctonia solani]
MPTRSDVLGASIPNLPHAISVSLPTWDDNIGYEEGDKRVVDAMVNGYPRFFIHRDIQTLAGVCEKKFGNTGERCFLFPAAYIANACRQFIINRSPNPSSPVPVRLVQYFICPGEGTSQITSGGTPDKSNVDCVELHVVLFQEDAFSLGKQFWQHTGLGISSRLASAALDLLARNGERPALGAAPPPHPRRPSPKASSEISITVPRCGSGKHRRHLRSTFSHLSPKMSANAHWQRLRSRRRIAGVLVNDSPSAPLSDQIPELGVSQRGIDVTENDVFLFPTGMAAIWTSHQLALASRPQQKSVLTPVQFSLHRHPQDPSEMGSRLPFFRAGQDTDIDELSSILQGESILALYTEFPSNPLLRSANLPRLRELANKHDFLIVVDETVGSFVNVEVLPYADIVVSSLSKVFSGEVNVMGGSLVLNPKGKHYEALKSQLQHTYEDTYWGEDALFMERNSRDFIPRVHTINENTEALCEFLRNRSFSVSSPAPGTVIKEVYYPKWETRANYGTCRRTSSDNPYPSGFGGLFSVTFTTIAASRAFFDNLDCAKGPSLGTNFTLACPYTILAHYAELDWAEGYGVETGLVRVSVGLEGRDDLLNKFRVALEKAEEIAHEN